MAEARVERLKRMLGGNLPLRLRQPLASIEPERLTKLPDAKPDADDGALRITDNVASDDWTITTEQQTETSKLAHPPLTEAIQPLFTPKLPEKGFQELELRLEPDSRRGEPAPIGLGFCTFLALTKFPYKFVNKLYMQPVASAFFDAEKIFQREWDFYYIWSHEYPTSKPVTFVTTTQFQELVSEINAAFPELKWQDTQYHHEEGLLIDFDDPNPYLRPRWLGCSKSRDHFEALRDSIPECSPAVSAMTTDARSLEAFRAKIELASEVAKSKSKAAKARKKEVVVVKRQGMTKQILRAQRYLGLTAKHDSSMADIEGSTLPAISFDQPAPHPFDSDVIFIAIDVEAWEKNQGIITEVGVATLDTRDLVDKIPGPVGEGWHSMIRARHFRIIENKHHNNTEFITGCADKFEHGQSEFVSQKSMPQKLTSCFHEPFSKVQTSTTSTSGDSTETTKASGDTAAERRSIVLVGHDINQDIAYCHRLGFSVTNRSNLLEVLDTADMYRSYSQDPNSRALGRILVDLDLPPCWYLHNAGNDAVCTLWIMLATCIRAAAARDDKDAEERRHEREVEKRTEAAIEAAKEKVREDVEGWVLDDDEDGGAPVSPSAADIEKNRRLSAHEYLPLADG